MKSVFLIKSTCLKIVKNKSSYVIYQYFELDVICEFVNIKNIFEQKLLIH